LEPSKVIVDCNTCKHHVQGSSIEDAPDICWSCIQKPGLANWAPLGFTEKASAMENPCMTLPPLEAPTSALSKQVSGGHYKKLKIQPIEYIHANKVPFAEGNVIKYVTRWRDKGGIADLEKAKHILELLIELESKIETE
jgi:hypothetical protein